MTTAERDDLSKQISQLYEAGNSIRDIAATLQRAYGTVHKALHHSTTDIRPHGSQNPTRARRRARTPDNG